MRLPLKGSNRSRVHWAEVLINLQAGSLELLSPYLRQTKGAIHPLVAKRLALLLDGDKKATGYRISIGKHPDIRSRKPGREQSLRNLSVGRKVANYMADQIVTIGANYKQALYATATHFGISERTVQKHWSPRKESSLRRAEALEKLSHESAAAK